MNNLQEKFEKYIEWYEHFFPKFEKLVELYLDWNSKINTSSIKDEDEIVIKHFLDSLLWNECINFEWKSVLDVWSWGWFPTIPLALTNPWAKFKSLDSVWKKLKVIENIWEELWLKNISGLHWRAEDLWQDKKHREKYDMVVTRAFAPWTVMLELTGCFIKEWWYLLAYQTESIFEDIRQNEDLLDEMWLEIMDTFEFELPEEMWDRILVLLQKTWKTPKKFPRKVWIPRKQPL